MELTNSYEQLIVRYLQNECSDEEKLQFFNWLEQSEENRKIFFQLKDIRDAQKMSDIRGKVDVQKEWTAFKQSLQKSRKAANESANVFTNYNYLIPKIAASIILILGITWLMIPKKEKSVEVKVESGFLSEAVPQGEKLKMVLLNDGSRVWLNSGSSLRYPAHFTDSVRLVSLEGEAYFEVQHDPSHPFIVDASGMKIRVLGTSFNVMSYGDEGKLETTLVKGSVVVENVLAKADKDKSVTLKPHQRMTCTKKTGKITVDALENTDIITAWKDGIFLFKSTPLDDMIRRLERHYNVKFIIESPEILGYKYSGTFEQPATIKRVMEILEFTYPIRFEVDGNEIRLSKKK